MAEYADLASIVEHTLLGRALTDADIAAGCDLAVRYGVAAVTVRPCDIDVAVRMLGGSSVAPGSVCGYPYGDQNTGTKLYEARDLLRRGAKEIDVALNVSKILGRQFPHIETELLQMAESCHKENALLKVTFDNEFLSDELRTIVSRVCYRAEADWLTTDIAWVGSMTGFIREEMGLIAAGVQTLDEALSAVAAGCGRIRTANTAAILDEWKVRLASQTVVNSTVNETFQA
jgi:deoxyribose-phosphate aldolase